MSQILKFVDSPKTENEYPDETLFEWKKFVGHVLRAVMQRAEKIVF